MPTSAFPAVPGLIGSLLWLALLHATWLGLAVPALAALATRGRSPGFRRAWLASSMLAVAIGPPILAIAQYAWSQSRPVRPLSSARASAWVSDRTAGPESSRVDESSVPIDRPALDLAAIRNAIVRSVQRARPYLTSLYLVFEAVPLAVLALGMVGVRRLRRGSRPADPGLRARADRLARRLRIRSAPAIRVHDSLAEPCLCGVADPAILLPSRWLASASRVEVDAVLAHELAHARRRDPLWNLFQRVIEALLFFHPPVQWLSRSLRRQGEFAADRLATRLIGDPLPLARALEALARLRIDPAPPRPVVAALGPDPDALLGRIQELIGMTPQQARMRSWPFLALPLAAVVAMATASAQEPPPQPPTPAPTEEQPTPQPLSPAQGDEPQAESRMIRYDVALLAVEPREWETIAKPCVYLKGMGKLMYPTPEEVRGLLEKARDDSTVHVIRAPRVAAYEGAHAYIFFSHDPSLPDEAQDAPMTAIGLSGRIDEKHQRVVMVFRINTEEGTDTQARERFVSGSAAGDDQCLPDWAADPVTDPAVDLAGKDYPSGRYGLLVPHGRSVLLHIGRRNDREMAVLVTPHAFLLEAEK